MLIDMFKKVTNFCNETRYCTVQELDGSIHKEIWGEGHDPEFLKDTLKEEVGFQLRPANYIY